MKVKALWSFVHGARRKKGEVFDIDDRTANALIQKNLVEQYVVPETGTGDATDQPDAPPPADETGTGETTDQPDAPPPADETGTGETTDQPDAPAAENEPPKTGKKK